MLMAIELATVIIVPLVEAAMDFYTGPWVFHRGFQAYGGRGLRWIELCWLHSDWSCRERHLK